MVQVLPFLKHHTNGVIDVILSIQRDEYSIPITIEMQPDLLDIPGFYQKDHGNFWVAVSDGKVVGVIGLLDIGNNQGALRKMFVSSSHRGPQHGTAKKLLYTLLDWSKSKSLESVYLGTTSRFLAAHRFYEKNGFFEISRDNLPEQFPVMSVDTKFYCIKL